MNASKVCFDVTTMTLTVSKKFFKQASIPFTEEYQIIKTVLADYPNCKVVMKQQPHNHCKHCNPTYETMIACIQMQPNADELMKEFMEVREQARTYRMSYNIVRLWFRAQNLMDFDPAHAFCNEIKLAA